MYVAFNSSGREPPMPLLLLLHCLTWSNSACAKRVERLGSQGWGRISVIGSYTLHSCFLLPEFSITLDLENLIFKNPPKEIFFKQIFFYLTFHSNRRLSPFPAGIGTECFWWSNSTSLIVSCTPLSQSWDFQSQVCTHSKQLETTNAKVQGHNLTL